MNYRVHFYEGRASILPATDADALKRTLKALGWPVTRIEDADTDEVIGLSVTDDEVAEHDARVAGELTGYWAKFPPPDLTACPHTSVSFGIPFSTCNSCGNFVTWVNG